MYTCRECERPINQGAELCPYCGADLTEPGPREPGEPRRPRRLAGTLVRWGVLLAGVWMFLWFVLPERPRDAAAHSESRAMEAVGEVVAALAAHADAQGTFPTSLDGLSPEALEQVRRSAQRAQREGYQLLYTPGPPGPDGRVRSYALLARAGHHGFRNFYADESRTIRATRENRPATSQDPPIETSAW